MPSLPPAAIVETNPAQREYLRSLVATSGFTPFVFEKETTFLDNLRHLAPCLIVAGPMPPDRSIRLVNSSKLVDRCLPLLLLYRHPTVVDFVTTYDYNDVLTMSAMTDARLIKGAIRRLTTRPAAPPAGNGAPLLVGQDGTLVRIRRLLPRLAGSLEPLMIVGEDGTGKEHVARAVHFAGGGTEADFARIDALRADAPPDGRPGGGRWSAADAEELAGTGTGTVFVANGHDAPHHVQEFLMRLWERSEGRRRFDGEDGRGRLRFIVGTEIHPATLLREGRWPPRRLCRFDGLRLYLPPLRQRASDVGLLADFFLDQFCHQSGRVHYELTPQAKRVLSAYHWPGNVGELRGHIFRTVIRNGDASAPDGMTELPWPDTLPTPSELSLALEEMFETDLLSALRDGEAGSEDMDLRRIRERFVGDAESRVIRKVLQLTNWNRRKASRLLGISYKSLLNKVKEYELA